MGSILSNNIGLAYSTSDVRDAIEVAIAQAKPVTSHKGSGNVNKENFEDKIGTFVSNSSSVT